MSKAIMISKESQTDPRIVQELQKRLMAALPNLTLKMDGRFGELTEQAVKDYQKLKGLTVDGIIGEKTFASLTGTPPAEEKKYTPPKRGKVLLRTVADKLHFALGCIGAPVKYHLEYPNGGTDPEASMPCDEHTGFLDCSGFDAFVQGHDRYASDFPEWDGYMNTDSKIYHAEHAAQWFQTRDEPEVGDMIIGETYRTFLGRKVIGHEGTIVDVSEWKTRGLAGIQVVHCSPSNYQYTESKSAIWKTSATRWGTVFKKYRFVHFDADRVLKMRAARG